MSRINIVSGCLAVVVLVAAMGCSSSATGSRTEITISAAASLTDAFQTIQKGFESSHPDVSITYNFGSSGGLAAQIEQGAPVDVFASADQQTMDGLVSKGLILTDTRRDFVANKVVLIRRKGTSSPLKGFEDLAREGFRKIAIGNPESVPAGRYARDTLTTLGLWEKVRGKLILGEDVRQVLSYVERGEVDAGLVFTSDADTAKEVELVALAPPDTHKPIVYPVAVVARSKKVIIAKDYIDFLLSVEGQRVLQNYGFKPIAGK